MPDRCASVLSASEGSVVNRFFVGTLGDGVQGKGAWPCGFVGFVHNVNHRRINIVRARPETDPNCAMNDICIRLYPLPVAGFSESKRKFAVVDKHWCGFQTNLEL